MRWAKDWQRSEGWDHRIRVMTGFDPAAIEAMRAEYPLERLAKLWCSYQAKDAMEKKNTGLRRR